MQQSHRCRGGKHRFNFFHLTQYFFTKKLIVFHPHANKKLRQYGSNKNYLCIETNISNLVFLLLLWIFTQHFQQRNLIRNYFLLQLLVIKSRCLRSVDKSIGLMYISYITKYILSKRNNNFDIWWQKLLIEKQIENDGKYFICLRFPTISHTCDQRFTTCRRIYLHQLTCCCRCCSLNIQPQNVINIIYSLIKHEQASVSRCIYMEKCTNQILLT